MFAVQVTDNSPVPQTATQALSLTIGDQLTITTSSLPPAVFGATYNYPLSATGGTAPYKWILISGTLPPGLSLSLAGYIVGTCTGSGVFTITVQATDGASPTAQSATRVLTVDSNTSLSITSGPLPPAQLGQGYTSSLTAAGGVPPYTWIVLGSPCHQDYRSAPLEPFRERPPPPAPQASLSKSPTPPATPRIAVSPSLCRHRSLSARPISTRYNRFWIRHHAQRHRGDYALFMEHHQWQSPCRCHAVQLRTPLRRPEHCWTASFTVQVTDNTQPTSQTASKALSIVVTEPLSVTSSVLPNAITGTAYPSRWPPLAAPRHTPGPSPMAPSRAAYS